MSGHITAIIQTTNSCNFYCKYCYVLNSKKNTSHLPLNKIDKLIKNVTFGFDEIEFCWHGGEPLLSGIEFYSQVIENQQLIIDSQYKKISNVIQTNGSLLNSSWLDFIQKNKIGIGISLDSPSFAHIDNRLSTQNEISYKFYVDLIKELKTRKIPVSVICVITNINVSYGVEIFNELSELGIDRFSLLPLMNVNDSQEIYGPSNQELFDLYKNIFDLWLENNHSFKSIEPIENIVKSILGENPSLCSFSASCPKTMASILPDGNIVPCGSLVEDKFNLGNIFDLPLMYSLHTKRAKDYKSDRQYSINNYCSDCEYLSACRGGCREAVYWTTKDFKGKYPYCSSRKNIFKYIKDCLIRQLC